MLCFGTFVLYATLLSAVLTILVGLVQIADQLSRWCPENAECLGPALHFDTSNFIEDQNEQWRRVFTFRPDYFADSWAPLVMGLMSIFVHISPSVRWNAICSNWYRICFWWLFVALWGNFGYAGGFGILVGFVSSVTAVLALMIALTFSLAPTVLEISCSISLCSCSIACCASCLVSFSYVAMIAAALGTLTVGIIHVVLKFPDPCNPEVNSCVGEGLFWPGDNQDFVQDINGPPSGNLWRSMFTLAPTVLLDIWTPFVFGVIATMTQLTSNRWEKTCSSWTRVLLFHLVMALFANFGYAGCLGVLIGFISIVVASIAFILIVFSSAPERTHADVDIFAMIRK